MKSLDQLQCSDFASFLNQILTFHMVTGETFDVELVELQEYKYSSAKREKEGKRKPFSIFLRGAGDPIREQRMYRLIHHELGTHDIFLVPVGRDEETSGILYEASFN